MRQQLFFFDIEFDSFPITTKKKRDLKLTKNIFDKSTK